MIEYVVSLNGKRFNIFKDELSDLKSQSRIHLVVSLKPSEVHQVINYSVTNCVPHRTLLEKG